MVRVDLVYTYSIYAGGYICQKLEKAGNPKS